MEKIATDTYTFERLRRNGFTYVDILKAMPLDFSCIDIEETELGNYEPTNPKGVTLLFQTGYLTIDTFRQRGASRRYTLRLPNLEVENSFLKDVEEIPARVS